MVAERRSDAARLARRIADVLVPLIMEEIVEIVKVVFHERIAERICEQIVDVHVPRAVEQVTEVPKTSSRDRTLQCTAEQILDVLAPEMAKQLVEAPETVSRDKIQQRTVEQIVDAPVPQAVEELAEVFRIFSLDRIQQRAVEQTIENPAISLAGMIVEMPVTRKTQQIANTHVEHVVNTVEAERPKIIKETVQRKKPIIQEKINQVTKHVEVPEVPLSQFTDKVIDKPVVARRQIPMVQAVQKTMEIPQLQCVDEATDDPAVQVPRAQVVEKTVGIPQFQIVEKTVEALQLQIGTQTSESLGSARVRQVAQVSPRGVVKPDDPDAGTKFLVKEAVHGNRLANELGRRECLTGEMWKKDCVTGEMWKKKPPFRLALNRAASDEIARHCRVRKLHESGTALAEDPEAPVSKMPDSSEAHDQASLKSAKDWDGEPYPAFASEKSRQAQRRNSITTSVREQILQHSLQ